MENPLEGIKGLFYTVKFESDAIKDTLRNDKKELVESVVQAHKIHGSFDFTGVTQDELVNTFLCSTTSVLKAYQNNVLKGMVEKDIIEMAKVSQIVLVRDLLDNRSSKIISDEEKKRRFIRSELKKGKSPAQVKESFLAMLDEMEKELDGEDES